MKGECSTAERVRGKIMTALLIGWGLLTLPWFLLRLWIGAKRSTATPLELGDDPITRAYADIWGRQGRAIQTLALHVEPAKPGLRLEHHAPHGEGERVVRTLRAMQPDIVKLIDLSLTRPADWSVLGEIGAFTDIDMKHPRAWFQNFARAMSADAARCWDEDDAPGAAIRVGTIFRWATQLFAQPDDFTRMIARMVIPIGQARAAAQLEAGLRDKLTPEQRAALADEIDLVENLSEWRSDWAVQVTRNIRDARRTLDQSGPPGVLAELSPLGGYSEDLKVLPPAPDWCGRCALPLSWRLAAIRTLGAAEVRDRLVAAERIVARITQAQGDAVPRAVLAGVEEAAIDPTHLLRALLGSPGVLYATAIRDAGRSVSLAAALRD